MAVTATKVVERAASTSALARLGHWLLCRLFVLYVASNMMLCAVIFAPWALPRETISGLLGRYMFRGSRAARVGAWIVDRIYFWEPNHCIEVFLCERDARLVLYPEKPGAKP